MGDRGRKTSADLSSVATLPVPPKAPRPPTPPRWLDKEQKAEWRRVVKSLPVGWFPKETHSMLAQYCKHYSEAIKVGVMIQAQAPSLMPVEPPEQQTQEGALLALKIEMHHLAKYDSLLKMQERESRAMTALARSLRFTLQASYDKERKKGKPTGVPWEAQAAG